MNKLIDPTEPIAIIGIGGVFPDAADIQKYWRNILRKVNSIIEVPQDRWDWRLYYDPDPSAPDKTYSKIGGFVRELAFDPIKLRIPPPVAQQMDTVQKMAVVATAEALADSGYDKKPFDGQRTAVIFGNSMGGPKKEATDLRVYTSAFCKHLEASPSFKRLPAAERAAIAREVDHDFKDKLCLINEDTMPGELSNVIAGRVANTFNLNGPNFTVDAACAASLAALSQAVNGLRFHQYDLAVCGGVDQMMAAPAYVKFCKIGALSPDGSRPFDADANGFVMGEGTGVYILKRLSDALRDSDRVYAVIRAIGASSDGRGKGITAPNPKGQKLAVERTFAQLEYGPEAVGLLEAHGTSTKVGDVVEVQTASEIFKSAAPGSVALGSVKSQIGHLKAAAGAASLIKAVLALHHKKLPPSINFKKPNPGIDWKNSPFRVQTEAEEWRSSGKPRRAHVSAFGFGGTNFHVALEEFQPGTSSWTPALAGSEKQPEAVAAQADSVRESLPDALGGEALILSGGTPEEVLRRLENLRNEAPQGPLTRLACRASAEADGSHILAVAAESGAKLKEKIGFILSANDGRLWDKAPASFKPKGIHLGRRPAKRPKVGFLFPGQGSQYVDMLKDLKQKYQVVADTFAEADEVMKPLIGKTLSELLFTKGNESPEELAAMQERIKETQVTQPAVLAADIAIMRLLKLYGVEPDVVCGHSLGEYGALVAAGVLEFKDALVAVSSRAKEMAGIKVKDPGKMASVAAPVEKVEPVLRGIKGYVICANKNCPIQTVIAGETKAVEEAVRRFAELGVQAQFIEVSHAFHSEIVAPAQEPYGRFFKRIPLKGPNIPILSNVTADYYPQDLDGIRKLLISQIASPVEFIRQAERMYQDGVRVFVEVGPKRALAAFLASTLENKKDIVVAPSNHPKRGGIQEFNDLLSRLAAAGARPSLDGTDPASSKNIYTRRYAAWASPKPQTPASEDLLARWDMNLNPIAVSGISAGVPGSWDRVFREDALDCILSGANLIEKVPENERFQQLEKNLERVVKSETGAHSIQKMESIEQVLRLAARAGEFDISKEFGIRGSISSLLDRSAKLAIAAGLLALKDAGIPLVRHYKKTTTGSLIPTSWGLPDGLANETGVIFASAFPGGDSLIEDVTRFFADKYSSKPARELWKIVDKMLQKISDPADRQLVADWYADYRRTLGSAEPEPYSFSRSFILRVLSLGHAQMAQLIKAHGPCTQVNAACASTTQAVGIAEDWIRTGRAKRVLLIAADDVTNPTLMGWIGTGFLATGAATTKDVVSEAALPFDRRRNGMILGMGAVGMVIEDAREVEARGMKPLAELMATQFENSAFHVTRLNTRHVCSVMDRLVRKAERRYGLSRKDIASKMLFMSHETYTPAQGGSSAAEVEALKATFGPDLGKIVVTNTKGFTGHSMGASIEDVVAVRAMNAGRLPPIANYKEPDPELAGIALSQGGAYDCEYALRLGAGFGSQIAMTLMKRTWRISETRIPDENRHRQWLKDISGMSSPELEVVHNTLRIKDLGRPAAATAVDAPVKAPMPLPVAASSPRMLAEETVRAEVLRLVGEKTGYPSEMLELDLDMEADLGIDTVKQAELIGVIREKYGIARQENLSLKDYPTLRHVIRFVMAGAAAPQDAQTPVARAAPQAPVHTNGSAKSAAAALAPSALDESRVRQEIVALVSEKTGYPSEMLELDLDMEADLGIDTVKQAELIGVIREKYGIARQENLSLKDYPTLRHVIRFVMAGGASQTAAAVATAVAAPPAKAPEPVKSVHFERRVLKAYPKPASSSRLKLSLERPVVILAQEAADAAAFVKAVEERGGRAVVVRATEALEAALKGSKPQGLVDLTALGFKDFHKETASSFEKTYRGSARAAFLAAQALRQELAGKDSWTLFVTRLGGTHGCGAAGFNPLAGALTGLAKALRREGLRAKAVDFDAKAKPEDMARLALDELGSDDPRIEVGFREGKRIALAVAREALPAADKRALTERSVVLVTGGGQGLGAELAKEIARRYRSSLIIIGRTELSPKAAEWAKLSAEELKALKMRMWEDLKKDASRKATPALLEREFAKITKAADLWRNIEAMKASGSKILYLAADLSDETQTAKAVQTALKSHKAIDFVVHAAGLEESKLLAEKKAEDFDRVFKAKAHAAFHLVKSVPPAPGQTWVFFSSAVGRFGNVGQTDYAAASDFLAKLAAWLKAEGKNAVAFDLTAFSEIGMATRGGAETFLKSQGVDFMPPKTGVELMLADILKGQDCEVLLSGALGTWDSDGLLEEPPREIAGNSQGPVVRTFGLESDPWLKDHSIGGVPYVAGVMGLELFAKAAKKLLGRDAQGFSQVRFALPIKLLRDKPVTVRVEAAAQGELTIKTDFVTAAGIKLGDPRTHFTARLASEAKAPALPAGVKAPQKGKFAVGPEAIYSAYFHGPSFQVLAGVADLSEQRLLAVYKKPAKPLWPDGGKDLVFQPMLIEAAFQACGYRDLHFAKKMTLPDSIDEVRVFERKEPPAELYVHVDYKGSEPGGKSVYDACVFDQSGRLWVALKGYRMIAVA